MDSTVETTTELNLDELALTAPAEHDTTRLVRVLRGPGEHVLHLQTYADHPAAGGKRSDERPATIPWQFGGGWREPDQLDRLNRLGLAIGWNAGNTVVWCDVDGGARLGQQVQVRAPVTAQVESKSGSHGYWLCTRELTPSEHEALLRACCVAHLADPAVARTQQVLRLPGFLHQKDPANPFRVALASAVETVSYEPEALLKLFGGRVSDGRWTSYVEWNDARKSIGQAAVPEFGTEEWEAVRGRVAAYLRAAREFTQLRQAVTMPSWDESRSAGYWLGLITFVRLLHRHQLLGQPVDTNSLPVHLDPRRPEWLAEFEPRARFWVQCHDRAEQEADQAWRELQSVDKSADRPEPQITAYDPDQVSAQEAAAALPWDKSSKTGGWDLSTLGVVSLFRAADLYRGQADAARHDVVCPWADQHSDGKDEACVWEPSGGKPAGFKCLHSHGGTIWDVLTLFGDELVEQFCERREVVVGSGVYGRPVWPVTCQTKDGKTIPVQARAENTRAMLAHHRIAVRYNVQTSEQEITVPGVEWAADQHANSALAHLRELGRRYGLGLSVQVLEDHLRLLQVAYHPAADWLRSRPWDGQDRFPDLLNTLDCTDGQDPELIEMLVTRWMIGAAGVALVPLNPAGRQGFANQGVLVLAGEQGAMKTTWLSSLVPAESGWFGEGLQLDPASKDSVMACTRFWLSELGELDATFRRSDVAALKAWVTSRADVYRTPFDRREEVHPRRTALAATVNGTAFLADDTGSRRFWCVAVQSCDVEALRRLDRQQVWAQAAAMYEAGAKYWLDPTEQARLEEANRSYEDRDPLGDELARYWQPDTTGQARVPTSTIKETLRPGHTWSKSDTRSLTRWLRQRWKLSPKLTKGIDQWPVVAVTASFQAGEPLPDDLRDNVTPLRRGR